MVASNNLVCSPYCTVLYVNTYREGYGCVKDWTVVREGHLKAFQSTVLDHNNNISAKLKEVEVN